jgi:hypothetical protein
LRAERRSLLTPQDIHRALLDIEPMVAHAVDTEATLVSARQALVTARAFRLSADEAVYLDLAQQRRLPLATPHERLQAAAGKAGVELVPVSFRVRSSHSRREPILLAISREFGKSVDWLQKGEEKK